MNRFLFIAAMVMFAMGTIMLFTTFIPPCDEGRGTGLDCSISTGMVAKIDSRAKLFIFDSQMFTIGIADETGVIRPQKAFNHDGNFFISMETVGPIKIFMLDSRGGFSPPSISADTLDNQTFPSLIVTRSGIKPITQLFQWYLIGPFLLSVFFGSGFLYYALKH
jgi:hypothetical protein